MKSARLFVMALAGIAVLGCQSTSPRGGGMARDEGFQIVVPESEMTIKQGEVKTVSLTLRRGEYFKRDVTLDIKPTKGIGVEPASAMVKASAKPDVQVRINVPKSAALGDYRVYVKGTPDTGEPTSAEFTVKVVAP